jgi:hypothetical protein
MLVPLGAAHLCQQLLALSRLHRRVFQQGILCKIGLLFRSRPGHTFWAALICQEQVILL